ncbi:hypothetical protein [Aeromonas dhakensis]|uniref:hypothetical protein n=1 Tax=Aeromonas dhakensis TaxID=196024 RepID=UPI0005A665F5|nr:hypothetical protein [Aeromonas dhakensis]
MTRSEICYQIALCRVRIVRRHQELEKLRKLQGKTATASRLKRIRAALLDLPKLADRLDELEDALDVMDGKPPAERAANRLRRRIQQSQEECKT